MGLSTGALLLFFTALFVLLNSTESLDDPKLDTARVTLEGLPTATGDKEKERQDLLDRLMKADKPGVDDTEKSKLISEVLSDYIPKRNKLEKELDDELDDIKDKLKSSDLTNDTRRELEHQRDALESARKEKNNPQAQGVLDTYLAKKPSLESKVDKDKAKNDKLRKLIDEAEREPENDELDKIIKSLKDALDDPDSDAKDEAIDDYNDYKKNTKPLRKKLMDTIKKLKDEIDDNDLDPDDKKRLRDHIDKLEDALDDGSVDEMDPALQNVLIDLIVHPLSQDKDDWDDWSDWFDWCNDWK